MQRPILFLFTSIVTIALSMSAIAQTASTSPKNSVITGDVVSIDSANVVLKTAEGELNVSLTDKTEYKRVPPENPVLKAAVPAALTDIGVGDKLLVTGMMSADKKSLPAKSVYLMTKSDIAGRHQKDKERWATRGISGRIKAVDQNTKQITVEVRGLGAATSVVLTPKGNAKFLRYAPNSVTYSEAVASTVTDIAAGDMLRAVGDRSADGASFAAEEIVTGAFQTHAGTVKSVDAAKNEVVITELQSKKDVTVSLASTSVLKKFPEQMAQMMAARQAGGGPGGPGGAQMQMRPAGGGPGRSGRTGRWPARRNRRNAGTVPDDHGGRPKGWRDDRDFELKDGVSRSDHGNKTACRVEPFIRAAQMSAAAQGRGSQGSPSLSIPGLDGFDNP
jgi:hypothetical protein